jgi:hypothetical protein
MGVSPMMAMSVESAAGPTQLKIPCKYSVHMLLFSQPVSEKVILEEIPNAQS